MQGVERYQQGRTAQKNTADESGVQYSIRKDIVDANGKRYDQVVELDYGLFKKVVRKGKVFIEFIRNSLIKQKFVVLNNDGTSEIVEFAKVNERFRKDGSTSPKRVLGKLERAIGSTEKLVIINAKEVTEISTFANHKPNDGHQWLDQNGWDERKTFVMTSDQVIYPVILHIAKTRDGRNILYDVSVMISEGVAVDKGATSRRAREQTEQAVKSTTPSDGENIPHPHLIVKENEANYSESLDAQHRRRTDTLSNREVLERAYEVVDRQKLTEGQQYAMEVFHRHLDKLRDSNSSPEPMAFKELCSYITTPLPGCRAMSLS